MNSFAEGISDLDGGRHQRGLKDGRRWALNAATPRELRRLRRAVESADGTGHAAPDEYVGVLYNRANGGATVIVEHITAEPLVSEEVWRFWAAVSGTDECDDDLESADYPIGFVEGATAVWDEAVRGGREASGRLCQLIDRDNRSDERLGEADGRGWAATATPDELRRLRAAIDKTLGGDYPGSAGALAYVECCKGWSDDAGHAVYLAITGEPPTSTEVVEFWDGVATDVNLTVDDVRHSDHYMAGFVGGAMAVLDATNA